MTIQEQIAQLGQKSVAGIEKGSQGVQELAQFQDEMNVKKATYLQDRLEAINAVKKELGVIGSEAVQQKADELKNNIKQSVIKERKLGKMNFGKTIDVAALSEFNSEIDTLANLARTTKIADKIYQDAVDEIDQNEAIPLAQKGAAKRQVMQTLVDPKRMELMTPEDIMSEVSSVIDNNSDIGILTLNVLKDIGEVETMIPTTDGGSIGKKHSALLQMDNNGKLTWSPEGEKLYEEAFRKMEDLGYSGNIDYYKNKFLETSSRAFSEREGDKLGNMLKRQAYEENQLDIKAKKAAAAAGGFDPNSPKNDWFTEVFIRSFTPSYGSKLFQVGKMADIKQTAEAIGIKYREVVENGKRYLQLSAAGDDPYMEKFTGQKFEIGNESSMNALRAVVAKKVAESDIELMNSTPFNPKDKAFDKGSKKLWRTLFEMIEDEGPTAGFRGPYANEENTLEKKASTGGAMAIFNKSK